uniref:S100/CaBP-9k-type calcium binding subdomain domain-containing protein n=1 Tax=Phasianus colchicus TaxID=9054 RepID=A0A669QT74_PHACC
CCCKTSRNCTLEKALEAIVNIFHQYSIREGQLDLLNFNDFQTLLNEQAPNFLKVCVNHRTETDLNKDKELTFEEFTIVLTATKPPHTMEPGPGEGPGEVCM